MTPETTIRAAAQIMRDAHDACIADATDGVPHGIVIQRFGLSDRDCDPLRDAFVVVRTMQSAIGSARGARS